MLTNCLPAIIAPMEKPTFAIMFIATPLHNRSSSILVVSRAEEEILVREPQNPTATRREYFESRFHTIASIEDTPRIKLPMTLTSKTLMGNVSSSKKGVEEDVILYLRKAPATAPTIINTNSITIPLTFFLLAYHLFFNYSGRHYQRLLEKRAV
jgi:hypothetical protein